MGKAYQNEEIESRPAVPDTVSAALAELTGELREGLGTLAIVLGCRCWPGVLVHERGEYRTENPTRITPRHRHVPHPDLGGPVTGRGDHDARPRSPTPVRRRAGSRSAADHACHAGRRPR